MAKYDSTKLGNFADPSHRGMAGGGQCGGHVRGTSAQTMLGRVS